MQMYRIALAGNPNCGKTTLFNALTGAQQQVGNWPGVTVERKEGQYDHEGFGFLAVDLPGTYSLTTSHGTSIDESIARDYLLSVTADLVVNVVDASNLERNLYLTTQLMDMQVPMVLALTKMDRARRQGIEIDCDELSQRLGLTVMPLCPRDSESILRFKHKLLMMAQAGSAGHGRLDYGPILGDQLTNLAHSLAPLALQQQVNANWLATSVLSGDSKALSLLKKADQESVEQIAGQIVAKTGDEADLAIAGARYEYANSCARAAQHHRGQLPTSWTERLDSLVLNRLIGIPVFFFIMYVMFLITINLSGAFIDFFDIAAGAIFVDGPAHWMADLGAPAWLITLLPNGVGVGVQTVATFIPIIAFLFLFLTLLEDSGYMSRAAFVMDKAMCAIGLPGKSFVPMLLGFGCTVPAIMATRTLEKRRDRIVTAMMAPFMSCGARLPVYALFAAAFFPTGGQNLVFLLYGIGIIFAVLTGIILKKTLIAGNALPFIMELPPYQLPGFGSVLARTWSKVKTFCLEAGQVIVIVVFGLSCLNSIGLDGSFGNENTDRSVLATIGKSLTPVVEPLGIHEENWPATVGLFTGIFAKEAIVGTLNSLYGQLAEPDGSEAVDAYSFTGQLTEALQTIPDNLGELAGSLADPLGLNIGDVSSHEVAAQEQDVSGSIFGAMAARFDGQAGAFAYLLMILLYTPCVAATAALFREVGRGWTFFAIGWTSFLGYGTAVIAYQVGTYSQHPTQSLIWITNILMLVAALIGLLRWRGQTTPATKLALE